ncbi:GPP34 family phosphoprotein [Streptomyces sp. NPDC057638]|uniref:GOLPH3/VPS74 family protein n=1 Tax=Streptomyces sp. NPDC057638 TaxID=3346190 RepID=UPI003697B325
MTTESLSLPARLYLLAWDTDKMKASGTSHLNYLVRAGALTELAQRGLLVDEDGVARSAAATRTGDPVLDGLLDLVQESKGRKWKSWVTHKSSQTLDALREQLAADGQLTTSSGMFSRTKYELARPEVVKALKAEARETLTGTGPVDDIAEADAAVVALAAGAELKTLVTRKERKEYKDRIEALTDRSGSTAPALKRVIHEVKVAIAVAVTAGAGAAGS